MQFDQAWCFLLVICLSASSLSKAESPQEQQAVDNTKDASSSTLEKKAETPKKDETDQQVAPEMDDGDIDAEKKFDPANIHMGFGKKFDPSNFHMGFGKKFDPSNFHMGFGKRFDPSNFHMGFGKKFDPSNFHMGFGKKFDPSNFHMGFGKRSSFDAANFQLGLGRRSSEQIDDGDQ